MAEIVAGVAEGCRQVGAALIGGEMAEHPGVMKPGEFDLVGFAVGVVERDEALGSARVRPGDVLIGLPSPGLRCNGYSLARHVLCERSGLSLAAPAWPGATVSLGEELIRPSVIYTPAVRAAIAATASPAGPGVHAVAHITGGGFEGNVPRALPEGRRAVIDRGTWEVPPIFGEIRRRGNVAVDEMARVFNLGMGMVLMVDRRSRRRCARPPSEAAAVDATVVGRVEAGPRGVDARRARVLVHADRGSDPGHPAATPGRSRTGEQLAPAHRLRGAAHPSARTLGQAGRLRAQVGPPEFVVHRLEADGVPSRGHGAGGRRRALGDPPGCRRHRRPHHGCRSRGLRHRRSGRHPGRLAQGVQRAQGGQGPRGRRPDRRGPRSW